MRKRKALPGEVGLFIESEVWEEPFSAIKMGAECKAIVTVPANLVYLKYFWALCDKLADNCSWILDKNDAKEKLLYECRHAECCLNPINGRWEVRPKSIANLSGDAWILLLRRCSYQVTTKFLPGMNEGALKVEIELMLADRKGGG